ncbi:MAG: 1,4-dihydroxy-2-naphthoate octaprenyltransferase [Methylophilaceae bacterium]
MIGFYFIAVRGSQILPIGLIGSVLVVTYTKWVNRIPLLCLIAPSLGFGVLMVVGSQTIIAGAPSSLAWLVSLIPFSLINNLLLLNQYPDIQANASNGRRTFPIAYGIPLSNMVYALFTICSFGLMAIYIDDGMLPRLNMIAICPIILALCTLFSGTVKHTDKIGLHPQYIVANVASALLTPLLLAIAITYG